jgi:hypothetical protein
MHAIYGLKPGETFWAASDLGNFKDLNKNYILTIKYHIYLRMGYNLCLKVIASFNIINIIIFILGSWTLIYLLWTFVSKKHDCFIRRKANRYTRCWSYF